MPKEPAIPVRPLAISSQDSLPIASNALAI